MRFGPNEGESQFPALLLPVTLGNLSDLSKPPLDLLLHEITSRCHTRLSEGLHKIQWTW